jgi:iron(III) transport system substrate-binding protein
MLWCVAVGLIAGLTSCSSPTGAPANSTDGTSSRSTYPWAKLTGEQREDALLEAARKEGPLSVYSAYNDEKSMAKAFTAKYGIDVQVFNANSETVLQRVVSETRADKLGNDVLVAPATDMEAMQDEKVLAPYESQYRDAVSDRGKGELWTGVRRLAFVVGYNTDKVQESDLPKDYSGFADPKWVGRLSMELSDYDWYYTLRRDYLDQGKSEHDVDEMFADIVANSAVAKGHTAQSELLSAGQFDVVLSAYTQSIDRAKKSEAPVTYGAGAPTVGPVVVRYDAGGLMAGTDNPAGAELYLDFQLTEDGFAVDREMTSLPPVPAADGSDPLRGVEVLELNVPEYAAQRKDVAERYERLIQG